MMPFLYEALRRHSTSPNVIHRHRPGRPLEVPQKYHNQEWGKYGADMTFAEDCRTYSEVGEGFEGN